MEGCMIEWWKEGCMDGRMDGGIVGWVDKWREELLGMDGLMDKWMGGW